MRSHHFLLFFLFFGSNSLLAQDMKTFRLYDPLQHADSALKQTIAKAAASGKHVFVQIGGNWCVWCARFHDFITKDAQLDSLVKADFEVYHLNYSPDNRNKDILARFGYPQRFGFPVFIILDGSGRQLHIQNSAYLEQDKTYSRDKVKEFFESWNPKALDPAQYIKY